MNDWEIEGAVIYAHGPWWKRLWWRLTRKWPKVMFFDGEEGL